MSCALVDGRPVGGGAPSLIRVERRTTVGAVASDVLVASLPAAGAVLLRTVAALSSYFDGGVEESEMLVTTGIAQNDGAGTVVFSPAFSIPHSYGPGVLPATPAVVVVGTDVYVRVFGVAGETVDHVVTWEAYTA